MNYRKNVRVLSRNVLVLNPNNDGLSLSLCLIMQTYPTVGTLSSLCLVRNLWFLCTICLFVLLSTHVCCWFLMARLISLALAFVMVFLFYFVLFCFETGSYCIALAGLEFSVCVDQDSLNSDLPASDSQVLGMGILYLMVSPTHTLTHKGWTWLHHNASLEPYLLGVSILNLP